MRLGVSPVVGAGVRLSDPELACGLAQMLERTGCESVWAVEHVVVPSSYESRYPYGSTGRMPLQPDDDIPDPLHWLTFVAACTVHLALGTGMLILPEHNPLHLAKRLATLDRLSGGRLIAGVGIGWLSEEYDALGVSFERRGARADEYIRVLRALWSPGAANLAGEFVRFAGVHSEPKPVRPEGIPLLVGGHSPASARRAGRLGDGFFPLGADADGVADLVRVVRDAERAAGREPGTVEITAGAPREASDAQRLADLGVRRLIMSVKVGDLARAEEKILRYQDRVVRRVT